MAPRTTMMANSRMDSTSIMAMVPVSEVTEMSICVMLCCSSSFVASMSFV